jgi:glycosyltransferase involved in cell wall biosynthesis
LAEISEAGPAEVSLIVPVYNSEATLHRLFEDLAEFVKSSNFKFEIVCVDDGSSDGSGRVLRDMQQLLTNVVIVESPVNRGQSKATLRGIFAARNELVVTLDDDLMHETRNVPRLLAPLMTAGLSTLVMGVASLKRPLWRAISGITCNAVSNLFLPKPLPLRMTTFCAFHRHLCAHLDPATDRDVALITELAQAADQIIPVPIHFNLSIRKGSRYRLSTLFRLFVSRSSCYKLSRVLVGLACGMLLAVASAALLFTRGTFPYWILTGFFSIASLMLTLLTIKMCRDMQAFDPQRTNPSV